MSSSPPSIVSQLGELSGLHEEVIGKIDSRTFEVDSRLRSWESHRRQQDDLFAWLRSLEREKSALNLKHVRVDGVPVVLDKIQVCVCEAETREILNKQAKADACPGVYSTLSLLLRICEGERGKEKDERGGKLRRRRGGEFPAGNLNDRLSAFFSLSLSSNSSSPA